MLLTAPAVPRPMGTISNSQGTARTPALTSQVTWRREPDLPQGEISFSCCLSTGVCFGPRGPAPLPPGLWGSGSAGSRDRGLGEAGGNHPGHEGTCRGVSVSSCRPAVHSRCWSHSCGRQAPDSGQVGDTAVPSFPVLGSVGIAPSSHPF